MNPRAILRAVCAALLCACAAAGPAAADDIQREPIRYSETAAADRVAALQIRLAAGRFAHDPAAGETAFLLAVMRELEVDPATQVLVFSKTSLQIDRISPFRPRALYFSDEIYLGWVPGGDIELAAIDPALGPVFYLLRPPGGGGPAQLERRDDCLRCHQGLNPDRVPGLLIRSVFAAADGHPIFSAGTHFTTHSSPLDERWGGWFVTGEHGPMRHMGNVFAVAREDRGADLDREAGANLARVPATANLKGYPRGDSDIVALMVLEHHVTAHNAIFAAHYQARQALHRNRALAPHLGYAPDELSESTRRVLENAADRLLRVLLFHDEFQLDGFGVEGGPDFRAAYARGARPGPEGRSLRDLQLMSRLFKLRCSPLVYSGAFANLPDEFRAIVLARLAAVLDPARGAPPAGDPAFAHLGATERQRIRAVLAATLPGMPR
jgi:hypothetical protein